MTSRCLTGRCGKLVKKAGLHLKFMNPLQTVLHSVFKYQLSQKGFVSYLKLNFKTMSNSTASPKELTKYDKNVL